MEAFLLLVGLALFITGAAMYLVHASQHEPRWVAGSLLMPLIVPMYYRRHWDDLQLAGLLQAAGLAMSVAGGLMIAFQPELPESQGGVWKSGGATHAGFVDSERALMLLARQGPGTDVAGRLHGAPFRPDRVELIDGVLRLRTGRGFVPDLEVAVLLNVSVQEMGRLKRVVAPDEADAPEIQMSWRDEQGQPVTRVFRRGYRLDLELVPLVRGKLSGYMQLTLPDIDESYVAGDLEVVTTHLRYHEGQVDTTFDHLDTLHFVAEEYLQGQYREGDTERIEFQGSTMDALGGRAATLAIVYLPDGRVGRHVIKAAKTEFGWSVLGSETAAATEAAGYKTVYNVLPPTALREAKRERVAPASPAAPSERTVSFGELASLTGQGAVVELANGRREQGVLRGLERDKLVLEATKGGGGVIQFKFSATEIAALKLNSGERIRLAGAAVSSAGSTVAAQAAQAPAEVRVGDRDLTPFMNRSVKVVTVDGKVTNGVFRGVNRDRLVVETQVGGGKIDYTVPAAQLQSIDFAGR